MLRDLNELAMMTRENYSNTFSNNDFKLSRDFKERFSRVMEVKNNAIQYFDYSAEITINTGNKIFCPNQWFYLATFVVTYLNELFNYKRILEELANSGVDGMARGRFMEKVKNVKGKDIDETSPQIKEAIINYFGEDTVSADFLCNFLTDYDWWFGSKTIDRPDFFYTPVLKLLGVVNVSQSYIAEIASFLASDSELMKSALHLQEQEFSQSDVLPGENLIVYGAPGTGKSHYLRENFPNSTRVVFHSEYSYYDFVGSYKPVPVYLQTDITIRRLNGESFGNGEPRIDYQFVPGPFIEVLLFALRNPNRTFTLLIEEINRANAPVVFGDIFQLLDRKIDGSSEYLIQPNQDLYNYLLSLEDIGDVFAEGLFLPANMNIVATMNSADQGVYVLDSAFKRRWKFKYMAIRELGFTHENHLISYAGDTFPWRVILSAINKKLKDLQINEDRLIGPYFISPEEIEDSNNFSSKLLIYLWDDVVRYKRREFFNQDIKTYSDLVAKFFNNEDIMNIAEDMYLLLSEGQIQAELEIEGEQEDLEGRSEDVISE
ncbi:AAA family ATPase [Neobacillus niacini]|uniref:AAA family ATPase n=1 Tax=Neobacillus niacini TaxID=86668 RepID=UPI002FFE2D75